MTKRVLCWVIFLALWVTACASRDHPPGRLAFLRDGANGTVSLWVMNGDGSELAQIVDGVTSVEFPTPLPPGQLPGGFSRGGHRLLFRATKPSGPRLLCADLDNKTLTDLGPENGAFDLAADGNWILLQSIQPSGTVNLVLISACDGHERKTIVTGANAATGSFSPDGQRVLVTTLGAKGNELKLVETSSGDERTLASSPVPGGQIARFTSDGQFILAVTSDATSGASWKVFSTGSDDIRDVKVDAQIQDMVMPDKANLLVSYFFSAGPQLSWLDANDSLAPPLLVGGEQYSLTPSPTEGTALVTVQHGGLADFYLTGDAGKQFQEILVDVAGPPQWAFAPDGRHLAISGQVQGREEYVWTDVLTGQQTRWRTETNGPSFAVSSDGQWVIFSSEAKGKPVIYAGQTNQTEPQLLVDNARQPVCSP